MPSLPEQFEGILAWVGFHSMTQKDGNGSQEDTGDGQALAFLLTVCQNRKEAVVSVAPQKAVHQFKQKVQ